MISQTTRLVALRDPERARGDAADEGRAAARSGAALETSVTIYLASKPGT